MIDIRWKQRFSNFDKAYFQLSEFLAQKSLNKFELQGLIQCFEYTFELAWKTMKDFLIEAGFTVTSPRDTIQTAFSSGLIEDGHLWIDAMLKRNLFAHTYNENLTNTAEDLIRNQYYGIIKDLHSKLASMI